MELWKGKVAIVTGASSGIGAAVCKDLCRHGIIVLGAARRLDRLKALKKEIESEVEGGQFYPARCDITVENEIKVIFDYAKQMFGGVDIMINNAGVTKDQMILDKDNLDDLNHTMNVNLTGLISCTKKAFESMAERDVPGYIINVSSVAGHGVPHFPGFKPSLNVYFSSKHALTALNTVLRHELNYLQKSKIRCSNISPGAVRTEIFDSAGYSPEILNAMPMLNAEDISNAIVYLLGTNPRVQIQDFIIRPTGEQI